MFAMYHSPRDRERAAALYAPDWMETLLHLPPPRTDDDEQWSRAANALHHRIHDGRDDAEAWMQRIGAG